MRSYKADFFQPLPEKEYQFYVDKDGIVCQRTWLVLRPSTIDKVCAELEKKCTTRAKTYKVK